MALINLGPEKSLSLSAGNAKTSFRHQKPMAEKGMIWARLGKDRRKFADITCICEDFSVSARVRAALQRDFGQDSAVIFIDRDFIAAAVFDGYNRGGTLLSETLADKLIETLAERREDIIAGKMHPGILLRDATEAAFSRRTKLAKYLAENPGGATAVLAVIKNGYWQAAKVSDSALFVIEGDGGVKRPMEDTTYLPRQVDARKAPKIIGAQLDQYIENRHRVTGTICLGSGEPDDMILSHTNGSLDKGETIILATDGVTKNLKIKIDAGSDKKKITDASGCEDLADMVRGKKGAEGISDAVHSTITARVQQRIVDVLDRTVIDKKKGAALCVSDDDSALVVISRH